MSRCRCKCRCYIQFHGVIRNSKEFPGVVRTFTFSTGMCSQVLARETGVLSLGVVCRLTMASLDTRIRYYKIVRYYKIL